MQLISLYKVCDNQGFSQAIYRCFHPENGSLLEKEGEKERYEMLCHVDNASNIIFKNQINLTALLSDLEIVIKEITESENKQILNHLKEIMVLAKFCLWNLGDVYLEFSPWGVDLGCYPDSLPEKYRYFLF